VADVAWNDLMDFDLNDEQEAIRAAALSTRRPWHD
jgi:hypothetical protein